MGEVDTSFSYVENTNFNPNNLGKEDSTGGTVMIAENVDDFDLAETAETSSVAIPTSETGKIEIELDKLKEELATLKKTYENIHDLLTESKTEFKRVPNYWQGDCGETVDEGLSEFVDNYKDFEEILKNYITHLEDSITEYESHDEQMTLKGNQNLSDQPSGEIS